MVRHYIVDKTGDPSADATDIVDRGWGPIYMALMDRHADGHRPPDTVLGVASLAKKGVLYECEVTALVHE
jgi:enamine deaminase RidA (YjgF/YER057c/UK114 family)